MRLVVFSHKVCWLSSSSPSGYATDGGFPFQMGALSELFEATTLVVPCLAKAGQKGEVALTGHNLSIVPLTIPQGRDLWRKLALSWWLMRNIPTMIREMRRADAVHTPIPGDIGTIGMLMAYLMRKPLFVRHCGNWFVQKTAAEHFWKWFIERFAGGRNVALATGGDIKPPSQQNNSIQWVFSTSLTQAELQKCSANREPDFSCRLRLIIVCRQEKGKGSEVVIQSLPLLFDHFPHTTLDIVGDGRALDDLKQLVVSLGLQDRVTFHGKVNHDRVISLLQRADLFCYPTASEGFPKVVLEALACGLPVVTTRVSVLPQLIGSGCGNLIDEATPTNVAQAVLDCINDSQAYRAMSARAKETAWQYSLERWRDTIRDRLKSSWGQLKSDA